MKKMSCSYCKHHIGTLHQIRKGVFWCDTCKRKFAIPIDEDGKPSSIEITCNYQYPAPIAVHGSVTVTGAMNVIMFNTDRFKTPTTHVTDLIVSGSNNHLQILLLDGATYTDNGSLNKTY